MRDETIRKYHRFLVIVQEYLQTTNQDNLSAFSFSEQLKKYLKLKKVDKHLKNMLDLRLIEVQNDNILIKYYKKP